MNANGFFRSAKAQGISLEGVALSDGKLHYREDVTKATRAALDALLASYDSAADDAADEKARHNAPILAELHAEDIKIVRALLDGDTARIAAHKAAQAARRAKLLK